MYKRQEDAGDEEAAKEHTRQERCRLATIAAMVASQEVKDFDDSMFTAIASYLALRTGEADARRMAKIFAPADKLSLFSDRIKQTEKYSGWFYSEGMRAPKIIKLTESR